MRDREYAIGRGPRRMKSVDEAKHTVYAAREVDPHAVHSLFRNLPLMLVVLRVIPGDYLSDERAFNRHAILIHDTEPEAVRRHAVGLRPLGRRKLSCEPAHMRLWSTIPG